MFRFLLNVLFPPLCLGCQAYLSDKTNKSSRPVLCNACFETIPINSGFYCPVCHRRLPEPKKICHPETKYLLSAVSSYQNPALKELIHSFKYQNVKSAVEPIKSLINLYLAKINPYWPLLIRNSLIIPVPLYSSKERRRGFNQATLIAEMVQHLTGPISSIGPLVATDVLIKIRNTSSQTELKSTEERNKNVAGAFKLNYPEKIKDKNIILVDDVSTSGATLNEIARLLKEAGAKHILAFVVAKA